MVAPIEDLPKPGRLVDVWHGGTNRDPAQVIAEHWARAPQRLRQKTRELTTVEQLLYRHIGNRAWMGAEVFPQVPLYVPDEDLGQIAGFFVPKVGVAIDVVRLDPKRLIEYALERQRSSSIFERQLGVVFLVYPEPIVAEDPKRHAELIRWDLGFADKGPPGWTAINIPRT